MKTQKGENYIAAGLALAGSLALVLLFALPSGMESFKALCNELYRLSEASNPYIYDYFDVPQGCSFTPALAICIGAASAFAAAGFLSGIRSIFLLLAAGLAGFQMYFGIALPLIGNAAFFGLMALGLTVKRESLGQMLPQLVCMAAVVLAVSLLAPGVDPKTETLSEAVRDRLSLMADDLTEEEQKELDQRPLETKHENRVQTADVNAEDLQMHYQYQTEQEKEIALPKSFSYLKTAVLFLLMIALLVVPFLPFILFNSRRRLAQERRADMESDDLTAAVKAAFLCSADYLLACSGKDENCSFTTWAKSPFMDLPAEYWKAFDACSLIWQQAVYSPHPLTESQKDQVFDLLDQTEALLYDEADLKTRLKLRFVYCLHE